MTDQVITLVVGGVGSLIGVGLTIIGYLLRASFEDFKEEVKGLREDMSDLTGSISDLAIKVSTGNVRIDNHDQVLSILQQEVRGIQDRCRSCAPR